MTTRMKWVVGGLYVLFLAVLLEVTAQLVIRITTGAFPITEERGPNAHLFAPHPYLVGAPRPGTSVERRGATASINSLGYRGPEVDPTKPPGVLRVVAVGGSTTFGAYLDHADTWPAQLQKTLGADVEVINAGVPGFTSAENLIQLALLAVHLKPDYVVLFQGLNDLRNANSPGLRTDYTNFHAPTLADGLEIKGAQRGRRSGTVRLASAALIRVFGAPQHAISREGKKHSTIDTLALKIFRSNLRSFAGICAANRIKCIYAPQVVTDALPVDEWWLPYLEPASLTRQMAAYNDVMRSVADSIPSVTFAREILEHQWLKEDFVDYCHFSARGSAKLARALAPLLQSMRAQPVNVATDATRNAPAAPGLPRRSAGTDH